MDANCQKSQKYFSFWIIPAGKETGFLEMEIESRECIILVELSNKSGTKQPRVVK